MKNIISIIVVCFFFCGCVSTLRKSPSFDQNIKQVQKIAVMPADIHVYKLTAGGVREEMDEWNATAKALIETNLKSHFGSRYGFKMDFVKEDLLKQNHKTLWNRNRALFGAVSMSALIHAYNSVDTFPTKVKNFDYTLGVDITALAKAVDADALLFVYGLDHESTTGRKWLIAWNAALLGTYMPTPSAMFMGLVDGKTGDLLWFKTSQAGSEYSFTSDKHIEVLIKWFTADFIKQK